jgi:hypothetical protein
MNCKDFEEQYIKNGMDSLTSIAKLHLNTCKKCQITISQLDRIENILSQKAAIKLPKQVKQNVLNTFPQNPLFSPEIILNILVGILLFFFVIFNFQSIPKVVIAVIDIFIKLPNILSFPIILMLMGGIVSISLIIPIFLKFQDYR